MLLVVMSLLLVVAGVATMDSVSKNTTIISAAELNQRLSWVEDCMTSELAVSRLTGKNWGEGAGARALCAADAYGEPRSVEEIDLMLDTVVNASKKNEMIRSACHDILHQIGVSAWNVGREQSLIEGYALCGMGYYHGLMSQALIGIDEREENITRLVGFCLEMSEKEDGEVDSGMNFQCSHGIGHAIGGVIEDIDEGSKLCQAVVVHRGAEDRKLCFTGALNQFILEHPASTEDPAKEVEGCSRFKEGQLAECYTFTLFYLKTKAPEVKEFCLGLEEGFARNGCWRGVGMIVSHEELFAGEGTPGYELVKKPESFAKYINDICAGDSTISCVSQLSAEAAEKVLNPFLMSQTCDQLATSREKDECNRIVSMMRTIHDLNQK
jgi:hypothetical protein